MAAIKLTQTEVRTLLNALNAAIDDRDSLADAYDHDPKELAVRNARKAIAKFKKMRIKLQATLTQTGTP